MKADIRGKKLLMIKTASLWWCFNQQNKIRNQKTCFSIILLPLFYCVANRPICKNTLHHLYDILGFPSWSGGRQEICTKAPQTKMKENDPFTEWPISNKHSLGVKTCNWLETCTLQITLQDAQHTQNCTNNFYERLLLWVYNPKCDQKFASLCGSFM